MDTAQGSPVDPRPDGRVKLVMLWAAAIGVALSLYVCAGLRLGLRRRRRAPRRHVCWFTWRFFHASAPPALTEAGQAHGGGLSQEEINSAIPAFEYRRKEAAAAEQCAVCINMMKDGETVRRLPACGHAFHAPCVDGWLHARATCPMCRAEVKVAVAAGETPAGAEGV